MRINTILGVAFLVALSTAPGAAKTIVLVSGRFDSNAPAASPDPFGNYDYVTASWTQTTAFENVSISIFGSGTFGISSGTAYVTTSFGPGTTVADQIARATFEAPVASPSTTILLFSGLKLRPGTYYVTIAAGNGQEIQWSATSHPQVSTASGVTVSPGVGCINGSTPAPYPPGTTGSCSDFNLRVLVTGKAPAQ